jgi:hypothetical protein
MSAICTYCGYKFPSISMGSDGHNWMRCSEQMAKERHELYGYVSGLLGLLQLVRGRDDMPPEIDEILKTSHRATDAASYLTQIVPPQSE